MNFIKPFDIPFIHLLPSLLHINVITGALQTYDTGPKAPANIDILVRRLKESVPLFSLSSQKAVLKISLKYLQMYESIQNLEDLSQDPCRSSSNRNRIQTKRDMKLSTFVGQQSEFLIGNLQDG